MTGVYAHVWEANGEALEWYAKRGFEAGEVDRGYYRRLKPDGARVVRRRVGVRDYLGVGGRVWGVGNGVGEEVVRENDGDDGDACGSKVKEPRRERP